MVRAPAEDYTLQKRVSKLADMLSDARQKGKPDPETATRLRQRDEYAERLQRLATLLAISGEVTDYDRSSEDSIERALRRLLSGRLPTSAADTSPWDAVILHWAKRAAGDVEETRKNDVHSCAFCQKYRPTGCCRDKCPIGNRTGANECINFGAYDRWRNYFRVDQRSISCSDRTVTPDSCRLAADVVLAICEMRVRWDAGERGPSK